MGYVRDIGTEPELRAQAAGPHLLALPGGGRFLAYPMGEGDTWRLEQGLARLSPESRRRRFHSPITRFPPSLLERLSHPDGVLHRAWGVCDAACPEGLGAGVARLVAHPDRPDAADLSITVLDEYQGRGLGRALLDFLVSEGRAAGFRVLTAEVLAENGPMLHLLAAAGARRTAASLGQVSLEIVL